MTPYAATAAFDASHASSMFTTSDISQRRLVTPAAIAGVIFRSDAHARNCSTKNAAPEHNNGFRFSLNLPRLSFRFPKASLTLLHSAQRTHARRVASTVRHSSRFPSIAHRNDRGARPLLIGGCRLILRA